MTTHYGIYVKMPVAFDYTCAKEGEPLHDFCFEIEGARFCLSQEELRKMIVANDCRRSTEEFLSAAPKVTLL